MISSYQNRRYFVYRHIVPNGKMYVGITSKSNPELRWGVGGKSYFKNKHFWNAIQKYGWDNIIHIVVAHNLTVDQACRLEAYLIDKYDSFNNGYNQTTGGVYPTEISEEVRNTISHKVKCYHSNLPVGAWSEKFRGHKLSEEAKRKIGAKARGRKYSKDVVERRKYTFQQNLTLERRAMYGSFSRGRILSEQTRNKISQANMGRFVSTDTRVAISQKAKDRFSVKHIWVHNADRELEIPKYAQTLYEAQGYTVGRLNLKTIYLTKDGTTIKVCESAVDSYLLEGWCRGFSEDRYNNIRKSKQKYIYIYKGITFTSGKALAIHLRDNGYPKIVQGTVNSICTGHTIAAYPELSIEIQRKSVNENI